MEYDGDNHSVCLETICLQDYESLMDTLANQLKKDWNNEVPNVSKGELGKEFNANKVRKARVTDTHMDQYEVNSASDSGVLKVDFAAKDNSLGSKNKCSFSVKDVNIPSNNDVF